MTVYRRPQVSGKATFDELVLRISLVDRDEILHAGFYRHELAYRTNGMSVACLRAEDTPGRSIFFEVIFGWCLVMLGFAASQLATQPAKHKKISDSTQLLYEFPWR